MTYLIVWTVLQDDEGRILLGRREGARFANGLWNLPGGSIEDGEGLAEAACREVAEEVCVRVEPGDVQPLGVSRYDVEGGDGAVQGVDFLFLARRWTGDPSPGEATSEVAWFDPDHLPEDCLPWLPGLLGTHLGGGEWLTEQLRTLGISSLGTRRG